MYAVMFMYNGLMVTYAGGRKQLLGNKHLQTVRLETALYIAVLHQWGYFI